MKNKWNWFIWPHYRHKFTFLFSVERWNDGEEWRINVLFWEFNFHIIDEEENGL